TPVLQRSYDLCYVGQAYELTVAEAETGLLADTLERFHELHNQRFGHSHPEQPVRIVAIRIKALIQPPRPELPTMPREGEAAEHALVGERAMVFATGEQSVRVYACEQLRHGNRVQGPALLVQMDSTILLPPGWEGHVDAWGNIIAHWR